jgi:hypothetical protein
MVSIVHGIRRGRQPLQCIWSLTPGWTTVFGMTATVSAPVAGSWIDRTAVITDGPGHQVVNPATGEAVAQLALATRADVDRAVTAARRYYNQSYDRGGAG